MTDILFLGVGNVANAFHGFVDSYEKSYGTTRSASKSDALRATGIEPVLLGAGGASLIETTAAAKALDDETGSSSLNPTLALTQRRTDDCQLDIIRRLSRSADVLVSFPPDGVSDLSFAQQIIDARKIIYVSSTSVYGGTSGIITEESPVDGADPVIRKRLDAEQIWRSRGAIVLRVPSLYGPDYGLHKSLLSGKYRLPGDGLRYSSRIHLEDLALIIEKVFSSAKPESLYLVGDLNPATQIEVVEWLCGQLRIPLPESAPIEEVHYTLRSNRQVCSAKLLTELGIELRFPTYKDGFEHCIRVSRSM